MNFSELKTELYARGTDYLEEDAAGVTRAELWLNQGYREICNLHVWPFLYTYWSGSANGVTGVSLPEVRRFIYVNHWPSGPTPGPETPLQPIHVRELAHDGVDWSKQGPPEYYWYDLGVLFAWPVTTDYLELAYAKRVTPLSGNDVPIFDEEYHNLIVDKAMIRAYIDGDNFEAAAMLKAEVNEGLVAMGEDYQITVPDPQFIRTPRSGFYDG